MFTRKYLMLILVLVLALGVLGIPSTQAVYQMVWSDEFDGSSLNTANWSYETGGGGWGNNELEYYTAGSNCTVSGGFLTITAKKESMGGYSYTSTRINTKGKREFKYGRIEARLAVPKGQGLWPAFWMLGANFPGTGWPQCGEIDIMEHINTDDTVYGTIHWDSNGYANYGGNRSVSNMAAFHTYSIEWTPSYIRWFVDGAQYWEANILNSVNGTDEFHKPFFIILNLAVGGNWPGSPNSSTVFPAQYQLDYIRVYQDNGGTATATPTRRVNTPTPTRRGATPTPTRRVNVIPTPTPVSGSGFTQGVVNLNSTQARFWFKPSGWTASYVIVHYTMSGASQLNVNMAYNSSAGQWEYTASNLISGRAIAYNFTYNKGGLQYDTGNYSWTKP